MALLLLAAATGCTSEGNEPAPAATGPVPAPSGAVVASPEVLAACAELLDALPSEIDPGVGRRPVEGGARFAAWGDPPVLLECGAPAGDPDEAPVIVNDVAWSVRDVGAGFRWTTSALAVTVSVEIPDSYENGVELVNPLAAPILATLPLAPSPSPPG